jgi:voltage-gated potassium channel
VDQTSPAGPRPGQPRSDQDAAALARFEHYMKLPIILAALLPLVIAPEGGDWLGVAVGVVSWLIFLADYLVNQRRLLRYLSTLLGRFDLSVVVLTAPWFLLPGAQAGRFVVLLRLARLARVAMASRGSRRLFERLGRVAIVAVGVVILGAAVAYHAEHATNPGFATYGDALWWGIVTLTTVGYGDIVPNTSAGRWAAVVIMITGISVLGLLAGSMASFFRLDTSDAKAGSPETDGTAVETAPPDAGYDGLVRQIVDLQGQMARLTEQLEQYDPRRAE